MLIFRNKIPCFLFLYLIVFEKEQDDLHDQHEDRESYDPVHRERARQEQEKIRRRREQNYRKAQQNLEAGRRTIQGQRR